MQTDGLKKTFQNPVYGKSFPDPFILRFNGWYFAYCTGITSDGLVFGRLRSRDLIEWEVLPGAMLPLTTGEPHYWAPEVSHRNGKFFLYYSVGNETLMTIRVAVSDRPDGTFIDAGIVLTTQDFAIDPHPFRASDGRWFLFYATDFLDHCYIGTGTVIDEMLDPFTLRGEPKPVTRAQYDWQIYDSERKEKGGVRWYTVEGPFVLERKGTYFEMFSGGNWQNITYGVSFAVSQTLTGDKEWSQYSDGSALPPLLRTLPPLVIGPGHNSVVHGPNGRELYCVYHRWENDQRVLAIDRMDFSGGKHLFVIGPSTLPQPVPYCGINLEPFSLPVGDGVGVKFDIPTSFLCQFSYRINPTIPTAGFKLIFDGKMASELELAFEMKNDSAWATFQIDSEDLRVLEFPHDIDLTAIHDVTVEIDHRFIRVVVDQEELNFTSWLRHNVSNLEFASRGSVVDISAMSITEGFELLFEGDDLTHRGWTVNDQRRFEYQSPYLKVIGDRAGCAEMYRKIPVGENEVCVNLRVDKHHGDTSLVAIVLCRGFEIRPGAHAMWVDDESLEIRHDLPIDEFHQFRFISRENETEIYVDGLSIGVVENKYTDSLSIVIKEAEVSLDMVRFTLI